MRTTIEINDEHRARLFEIAARRGLKGFSQIVAEAIDNYLETEGNLEKRREEVRSLQGSLSGKEAADLRRRVTKIRKFWR